MRTSVYNNNNADDINDDNDHDKSKSVYLATRHTLVRHRELLPTRYMGHTIRTPTFRYTEWRSFTPATYTTDWSGQAVAREPKPFIRFSWPLICLVLGFRAVSTAYRGLHSILFVTCQFCIGFLCCFDSSPDSAEQASCTITAQATAVRRETSVS